MSDADPKTDAEEKLTAHFSEPVEATGEMVGGKYKLLQRIGEGGMGAVYMARQSEPVRREVAIKIILPGMDSQQVLARFEAERQALAMLDHPNIARVLDAGTTGRGQPFFAMELIKGVPITQFCNQRKLPVRARLDLFIQICHAIQHAHQKGIIHRDIKPSNVLVALYDDKPVPKVIDFGVAKATTQQLTERTMFTQYGALVGTLEYMSPEQAQFNSLDIDTRTDIYSLGVLLYELLTGVTPFEKKRLRSQAFDEVLRIIREEEPPTPSKRLSTTEELATIAAERSLEPRRLGAVVRGDLDWIVMKCLEKERSRRYDSANGLAADVQRYLADEPVSAGPPRTSYRVRKFLRRHRGPVIASALLIATVLAGAVVGVSQAVRAIGAERLAKANEKTALEEREAALKANESERKAREVAERLAFKAAIEVDLKQMSDDPSVGLLRLAATLESIPSHLKEYREIVAANILAWGQELCPLQPLAHDGYDPTDAQLNRSGTLVLTRGVDSNVRLWETFGGTEKAVLKNHVAAEFASFTADGRSVVTFENADRKVRVWDAETGVNRFTSPAHRGPIRAVAFSGNGDRIATLCGDGPTNGGDTSLPSDSGSLQFFEAKSGRRLGQAFGDPSMDFAFVMDPRGRFLVTLAGDRTLRIFSISDRISSHDLPRPRGTVGGAFVSPGGERFALLLDGVGRRTLNCWKTDGWKQIAQREAVSSLDSGLWIDAATLSLKDSESGASETFLFDDAPKEIRRLYAVRRSGDLILGENGEVYDATSGLLSPPRGRRYHPSAAQVAINQRWLDRIPLVDFTTELDLGSQSPSAQSILARASEPLFVGLEVKSIKRSLTRNASASVPQSFIHLLPLPPLPDDAELLSLYCRTAACGTLGSSEKVVPDTRGQWERLRTELREKLEANRNRLPVSVQRIIEAACQDSAYWVRRQIAKSEDGSAADGLWNELLRVEPTWKNHLERAFASDRANRRVGGEQIDHLMTAWRTGGSQYGDVVFEPLMDAINETCLTTPIEGRSYQQADAALQRLLGEIAEGKRRERLVVVAALNAVRAKKLADAQRFATEYDRFVLQGGRKILEDAVKKRERGGKSWDEFLATKQRACISRCLQVTVSCLCHELPAAETALREADALRRELLDQARPEELKFQDAFEMAERTLRDAKA